MTEYITYKPYLAHLLNKITLTWILKANLDVSLKLLVLFILSTLCKIFTACHYSTYLLRNQILVSSAFFTLYFLLNFMKILLNIVHIYSQIMYKDLWKKLQFKREFGDKRISASTCALCMHLFIYLLLILVYIHYLTNIKDTIYTKVMAAVFLFTSVANIMVLYQFTYVMDIIIQLMKKINKEMESTEQFKSAVSGNLKLLTEQHNHLMDSAQIVNKIFSWQILTICLRSFMELTCHNYGLLVNLTKDYDKNIQDRIWHIFRILLNITEISTIVHFCEYFSKEAKKFNTYLFQYLRNKQMEFTKAEVILSKKILVTYFLPKYNQGTQVPGTDTKYQI
ncbi:uncharacterized protein isoform X2 [Rhodnius prolixus]|uniref:uncharacterized protein isoform X2 n=1 Tax=Rhodnius prolixus TaxID=13249 RepID=UPI003D18B172